MTDQQFAKQLGVQSISSDELDPNEWFEFKADGEFVYGVDSLNVVAKGKWYGSPNAISLQYETMNGRTISAAQEEIKKKAESGRSAAIGADLAYDRIFANFQKLTTLTLGPDKKKLVFAGSSSAGSEGLGSLGASAPPLMADGLTRVKKKS